MPASETPDAAHPYYQVGGAIRQKDWSAWHIDVSEPKQTYWLNHYPKVSHTIYKEDFEATIPMAAGATVTVRVVDGNNRQMDNAEPDRADRMQIIAGVTDKPLDGQMLRLPIPDLTEERRKELAKLAGQYAEKAKIAARNVRRDANDALKTDENKKEISEDDRKRLETEVQKMTDDTIKAIDEAAAHKEKEIMSQ